ncbi:MAG: hypothetical protein IJK77_04190 [Lachnospiraceae bacterium]|nr:hypothetical protein [Lachnospiraceae bacterium]
MRRSFDQSEFTQPGAEFNLPPEQSATLSGGRRLADRFGARKRSLAEPDEAERQAAEVLAEEGPAGEATGEELTTSAASSGASGDAAQAAGRKEKRKRSLLLQFAAVASSVVLVTNSFSIDLLGMDGLFNDSVLFGEVHSTEPDDWHEPEHDDEPDLIYGDLIPFGGDRVFPKLDNNDWTVTQSQTVDANNKYVAAVDFIKGSMGEQAMVESFVWYGRKSPEFYTGPIPMSIPANIVSTESPSLYYDSDTNTLTLNNYHGKGLMINNMGQDFTIRLIGDSVLSEYLMVACGSVTITGDGGITINDGEHYDYGIHVVGQWTRAHLMLDENVKFDISGAQSIFRVTSTCSEKPVCYKTPHPWGEIYQGQLKAEDTSFIHDDPETYHSWLMVGAQTHSTIVHVNNSYRPDGAEPEPSSNAPVTIVTLPVGGDSAFPMLPNPMPNSVGADGTYHESSILVWDKYASNGDLTGPLDIYSYEQNHPTGRDDIFYDPASNTLTLNNYNGGRLDVRSMGSSFMIRLIGRNELFAGIRILGDLTSGSVTFTGDGYLALNAPQLSLFGLYLDAGNAAACVMVDSSVTMDIYGSEEAIIVQNTSADKCLYYLSDVVPDLRQVRDDGESAPSVPGTFYDWRIVNERSGSVKHIHLGGEAPPEEPTSSEPRTDSLYPIGGDSSYPDLPNLVPGGMAVGGTRPQIQLYGEKWTVNWTDMRNIYGELEGVEHTDKTDILYDPETNTLTLNNCVSDSLFILNMANSFTIRLIGDNVLPGGIHVEGDYKGASVRFTGDGHLSAGSEGSRYGLWLSDSFGPSCVMIDSTVTIDLYGNEHAFLVENTSAPKGLYYESAKPIEGIGQAVTGYEEDPRGRVSGYYYDWIPRTEESASVKHLHLGPDTSENPMLTGLPIGGDSVFPNLPNPNPNTSVPSYGVLNEDYIQIFDRTARTESFIYVNPATGAPTVSVPGLSYDRSTNTLTMNNYHGAGISANLLGNGFTVELVGENELTQCFMVWGFYTGGSVHFTGSGSLTINSGQEQPIGLQLLCEFSTSCIMIDDSVTLDIYGSVSAVELQDTDAEKAIYLLSGDPLDNVRQLTVTEEFSDNDLQEPKPYYVWQLVDNDRNPVRHLHIEGSNSILDWFGR